MANRGDYYIVELERAHLEWGTHRYTDTRDIIYGEGYIQIPARKAYDFNIYNSNGTGGNDVWGENLFRCTSRDGLFEGVLRAQGNQSDDRYAKQFSEDGNLKGIGRWYQRIGARVGDRIQVTWTSSTDIIIEKL